MTPCRARARSIWIKAIRWPRPIFTWHTACTTRPPIWCESRWSGNRIGVICGSSYWKSISCGAIRTPSCRSAKGLESTRDRAPAGEWDKIVIMGKRICPDEPLFAASAGSGRGAGALVDLKLEGGENRVDIDLFGDPEGERSSWITRSPRRTTTRQPQAIAGTACAVRPRTSPSIRRSAAPTSPRPVRCRRVMSRPSSRSCEFRRIPTTESPA